MPIPTMQRQGVLNITLRSISPYQGIDFSAQRIQSPKDRSVGRPEAWSKSGPGCQPWEKEKTPLFTALCRRRARSPPERSANIRIMLGIAAVVLPSAR